MSALRPAAFCRGLLRALEASEGRRRRRKRDQTPDAIGLSIKRDLLERVAADDPAPDAFEGWLVARCQEAAGGVGAGAIRAMAIEILHDWRLAAAAPGFQEWLAGGAPSDDTWERASAAPSQASPRTESRIAPGEPALGAE